MSPIPWYLMRTEVLAMVDRVDLLIAVAGIVVSVLGSSTALWMAVSKKPDREDLARVEGKLDALIMRFVPGHMANPDQS
jgi:hypothetical protein